MSTWLRSKWKYSCSLPQQVIGLGREYDPRHRNQSFSLWFSELEQIEKIPFPFWLKEHRRCDDCRPSGDLVLYTVERVKLTPGRGSGDSIVERVSLLSPKFPVTATLPLILWAFIYSYNEHVLKQGWIQFLPFVPKSFSDECISLPKEKQHCHKKQQSRLVSGNCGGVSEF